MPSSLEVQRRFATARSEFLDTGKTPTPAVSGLVAASWSRSLSAGVDAARLQVPYYDDLDVRPPLARMADPVLKLLGEETFGFPVSVALTDNRARILRRVDMGPTIGRLLDEVQLSEGFQYAEDEVGTNGIGTVFESGQSVLVVGSEHFQEGLSPFACAGSPIRNPFSGRIEGVLDLTCFTEHATPLMRSLVRSVTQDIERNLLLDRRRHQQDLFDMFLRVDARTHNAVIAVGGGVVMSNTQAQCLFAHAEQMTLQHHAEYLSNRSGRPMDQIELPSGKVVRMRGVKVAAGDETVGVVLEAILVSKDPAPSPQRTRGDETDSSTPVKPAETSTSDYPSPLWTRAVDETQAALSQRRTPLVMGEAGVGKLSLVTEVYHHLGPGGKVAVIEAADLRHHHDEVEETVRGAAHASTLYVFRNIDELPAAAIPRFGALLQNLTSTGQDSALVAATISNAKLVSDSPFSDLLSHFDQAITVPSLRYRPDDLPLLVTRVLANISDTRSSTVSPAALHVLRRYSWPGNLRELEEVLSSALSKRPVGEIQPDDLPAGLYQSSSRRLTVIEAHERDAIVQALRETGGNRVQAAAALGIARSSLYRKLKSYGITTV